MVIMARLLAPEDFGLQGMALTFTGFLALFSDCGLSGATVQREEITHKQVSTLFWINVTVGIGLTLICFIFAPAIAAFYAEPRLYWVIIASGSFFVLSGVGAQHGALLQRSMRYGAMATIDIIALIIGSIIGIIMATFNFGYWALIAMTAGTTFIMAAGPWVAVQWFPGRPQRGCGIGKMLRFGGVLTGNGLVVYLGYNIEKVLLGRFWGAQALGLYGRAYNLGNLPVSQINTSIYSVALPALSRIQNDQDRLCRAFLKGYSILLSIILPTMVCIALFADEMVYVLLGPQWMEAAPVLKCLIPAFIGFALINPFGSFLISIGKTVRSFYIGCMVAPAVILGILTGIQQGPQGVAIGYSAAMILLTGPVIAWAIHDTGITIKDCLSASWRPILACLLSAGCGWIWHIYSLGTLGPISRLISGVICVIGGYAGSLLFGMDQKNIYIALLKRLLNRTDSE